MKEPKLSFRAGSTNQALKARESLLRDAIRYTRSELQDLTLELQDVQNKLAGGR
jgi:hypothetical protein